LTVALTEKHREYILLFTGEDSQRLRMRTAKWSYHFFCFMLLVL